MGRGQVQWCCTSQRILTVDGLSDRGRPQDGCHRVDSEAADLVVEGSVLDGLSPSRKGGWSDGYRPKQEVSGHTRKWEGRVQGEAGTTGQCAGKVLAAHPRQ